MSSVIVTVSEGDLRGSFQEGKRYVSFQGVPYAKAPVGELRFKPPEPPEKWQGIREAVEEASECYSKNLITNVVGGSEDCLYLNVYAPAKPKTEGKLPVMFWIHGGGFVRGSGNSDLFGPEYLMEKDVVLVTINYRLGVFGFLSFSDPSLGVTGNAGLKDMVMALEWVQRNISQFRGDPNNVTIFGESAGGAAVHLLILSPMAKGLFHKAIMQSGSALNCFVRGRSSSVYQLAHHLGIHSNDDNFILKQLRQVSAEELFEASQKIVDPFLISHLRPFCPVIEPKSEVQNFMIEEPIETIKSGKYNKVPMIMGYNSLDGVFILICMKSLKYKDYFLCDASLVPNALNLRIGSDRHKRAAQKVKNMYKIEGNECLSRQSDLEKAVKVYTHNYFMADIYRSALLHCENNEFPVYFYRFDLDTELNFMKLLSKVNIKGAAHADDLPYLFTNILNSPPTEDTVESKLIEKVTELWTNFAKNGKPTLPGENFAWNGAAIGKFDYLSMENEEFKTLRDPEKEFADFWINLHRDFLSKL